MFARHMNLELSVCGAHERTVRTRQRSLQMFMRHVTFDVRDRGRSVVTLWAFYFFANLARVYPEVTLQIGHAGELMRTYRARVAILSQVSLNVSHYLSLTVRLEAALNYKTRQRWLHNAVLVHDLLLATQRIDERLEQCVQIFWKHTLLKQRLGAAVRQFDCVVFGENFYF